MLNAGRLDRRITIKTKSVSQNDFGEEIVTWTDVTTVWAQRSPLKGYERWVAQQVAASVDERFRIRFRTDVSPEDIVEFEGREYDITSVTEIGRRAGLELLCTARAERLPVEVVPEDPEEPEDPGGEE